ncbi:FkbM family methyltransferase [Nocardia sp. NPDC050713]|uniref:FkbM family methyltransferase n=1 Tax=Nocardia sp. NPDC050713 TaxID=3154511 RepID=UPI0033C9541B
MLTTALQQLRLDDGRTVTCTSPAEARMLWGETTSAHGFYRRAAEHLRPGDIALDIGANIGLTAMMFADICPGIQVIAVEPAPMTYRCLDRNIAAHVPAGLSLELAVGASPGTQAFTWYPRASANSGFFADREADDQATRIYLRNCGLDDKAIGLITHGLHEGVPLQVEVTTVSAILDEHCRDREIGLLKVDVERAELDVLRGITDTDWRRIHAVVAEIHDIEDRLREVRELFDQHGMSVQAQQDPRLVGTEIHEVFATRPRAA